MVIDEEERIGRKQFWRQFSLVLISLGTFVSGCMHGWTAPALVKLQSGNDILTISTEEGSWLALYSEFGHFAAPVTFGIIADIVGRKPVFILSSLLAMTGWGTLLFANNLTHFLIGRTLLGFNYGIQCSMMNIYVAEISSKQIRGTFNSVVYMFNGFGVLFQFLIGGYCTLWLTSFCTVIFCCIHFILVTFCIIESPYYLVAVKKDIEAEKTLMWLRAASCEQISNEFNVIVKRVTVKEPFCKRLKNLLKRPNRKGFIFCILMSWLNDMTGRVPILTYATENFKTLGSTSANFFTVLLGCCNALLPFIPLLLSDRIGRKIIIIVSAVAGGVMHLMSGLLYFLTLKMNADVPIYTWLLFFTITGYLCCSSVFTTNVLTLRGEIISENGRGLASGFASMAFAFATLLAIKMFQVTRDYSGIYVSFWLLCCFSCMLSTFTYVYIPETKNKTFEEIQNTLNLGKKEEKNENADKVIEIWEKC